jgi:hypothetical protein
MWVNNQEKQVRPKTRNPWANTIAYYPLTSTTTVNDISGNNRNLTNNWVQFWEYDWVDCAYFNASSYLIKNWALFTWDPTFTVSFYAKCVWFQQYNGRAYWFVGTGDWVKSFWQWISANNQWHKLQIWWWSNDRNTGYTIDNNWHYIVFEYSNGAGEVYVDCNSIYSGTWSPNIEDSKTVIWWNPNLSDLFNWYISNFICENKIRTANERTDYYNQTKWNYWL